MATPEFKHYGVPTTQQQDNERYIEGAGVYITDSEAHPYNIEFLRFEEDSLMPQEIQTKPHVAFLVDDLDAALDGKDVVLEPFDATDELRVAFIVEGEALIELMEEK